MRLFISYLIICNEFIIMYVHSLIYFLIRIWFVFLACSWFTPKTSKVPFNLQISTSAEFDDAMEQSFSYTVSRSHVKKSAAVASAFVCDICHKNFPFKSYLTRHMFSHSGEKPLNCPYCDQKFYLRGHLNVHVQKKHCFQIHHPENYS